MAWSFLSDLYDQMFETPLSGLYRSTLPFLAILLASVLVITYVPPLTTTLVRLLGL